VLTFCLLTYIAKQKMQ